MIKTIYNTREPNQIQNAVHTALVAWGRAGCSRVRRGDALERQRVRALDVSRATNPDGCRRGAVRPVLLHGGSTAVADCARQRLAWSAGTREAMD